MICLNDLFPVQCCISPINPLPYPFHFGSCCMFNLFLWKGSSNVSVLPRVVMYSLINTSVPLDVFKSNHTFEHIVQSAGFCHAKVGTKHFFICFNCIVFLGAKFSFSNKFSTIDPMKKSFWTN